MADIRPFRGTHYNGALIKDWASVICAPYDIIPPQLQAELYLRSEYNFIRLEFGRELPQDTTTDNRYTRAKATLEQWLRQGVLETDKVPAIYLHDQYFTYQGKEYKRRGLIVRVRLEEWDKMVIRPHEGTMAEPKSDRSSLLWTLQANTSPVLALFADEKQQIARLLAAREQNKPMISSRAMDGERHQVWAITEPGIIDKISASLATRPLYIADGHHRYESALAYRRDKTARSPAVSGDEAFNYVMMELVDFVDPGLLILPPHRLVRGIAKSTLNELTTRLAAFFDIDKLPLNTPGLWARVEDLLAKANDVRLALFGLEPGQLFILSLRDPSAVSQMMPHFHSDLYKRLAVSIIDHIIMEKLLVMGADKEKLTLAYSYDQQDAISRVLVQEYQLALLLSPVRVEVIKAIADAGDKMPRKSTYFYPKLPSGLVFNRLVS